MTVETMINRAYCAEQFFTVMGMFFYVELIKAMREHIEANKK